MRSHEVVHVSGEYLTVEVQLGGGATCIIDAGRTYRPDGGRDIMIQKLIVTLGLLLAGVVVFWPHSTEHSTGAEPSAVEVPAATATTVPSEPAPVSGERVKPGSKSSRTSPPEAFSLARADFNA